MGPLWNFKNTFFRKMSIVPSLAILNYFSKKASGVWVPLPLTMVFQRQSGKSK